MEGVIYKADGEISNTQSSVEITGEDFHKQDEMTSPADVAAKVKHSNNIKNRNNRNNPNHNGNKNHNIRTATQDLYKYQVSNKPSSSGFAMEYQKTDLINVTVSSLESNGVGVVSRAKSRVVSSKESNRDLGLRAGVSDFIGRGVSVPLLDLHKVYDVDSLPSPTREGCPALPLGNAYSFGHGWPVPEVVISPDKVFDCPYETDAFKAVASYLQKFSQTSFFTSDQLSSPTPSEESSISDDISDNVSSGGDTSVEVASGPSGGKPHPRPAGNVGQPSVSTTPNLLVFPGQERTNTWKRSSHMPALKSSIGKKRKDPRLRLASDETMLDGPVVKRQRNEIIGHPASKRSSAVSVCGDWLQDIATRALQIRGSNHVVGSSGIDSRRVEHSTTSVGSNFFANNSVSMTANQSHNLPPSGHIATTSLQSVLKSVNPSLSKNLLKMEQQKPTNSLNNLTQLPTMDTLIGPIPVTTIAPPRPSVPGPIDMGLLQIPSKTVQLDESTKVCLKPHDPRRFLHGDSSQKRGGNASDQTNVKCSVLRQEDQSGSSPHNTPPNTSQQLIKSSKNINNIMSVSQATTSQEAVSHIHSTQAILSHHSKPDKGLVSDFGKTQNSAILASEDVVGQSQPQHSWSTVEYLFDGYDDKQKAAIQKERSRRMEEQRKMFASKKLCLVLDLDHTLLNSAKFCEVDPMHDEILRKKEEQDHEKPQRHLFRSPHMSLWTKLRPGIWNFLEKASKLFELHVCTMGNKLYATEMVKLLDPKGELFAGRVISRDGDGGNLSDGDERIAKSKDLEGVLGMESSVVIIDDSVRVWPHNKLNLIVVERYIYFPCSRRQFGLPGPSLLEIDHDERPEDGTLASSLAVIERIHQNFFTHQSLEEVDVRNILAVEQRKILAGCRIVFSRMFPVGEANPHLHPLWQTAEQFGAVCTTQIDEQVTHVVTNSVGTDKVNWAISNGRFIVHPHWVEASAMLYCRANEQNFTIKPQRAPSTFPFLI